MKKNSFGITIFTIIMLLYSLWLLVSANFIPLPWAILPKILRVALKLSCGAPLLTGFVGLIYLIASIGLLRMKNWGRLLTVYFSIFLLLPIIIVTTTVILGIIRRSFEGPAGIGLLILFVIIPLLPSLMFLIFFTQRKVKEQFQ